MLIYVTGLTQIPGDVLEAAQIDGATALQALFKVKLPNDCFHHYHLYFLQL